MSCSTAGSSPYQNVHSSFCPAICSDSLMPAVLGCRLHAHSMSAWMHFENDTKTGSSSGSAQYEFDDGRCSRHHRMPAKSVCKKHQFIGNLLTSTSCAETQPQLAEVGLRFITEQFNKFTWWILNYLAHCTEVILGKCSSLMQHILQTLCKQLQCCMLY